MSTVTDFLQYAKQGPGQVGSANPQTTSAATSSPVSHAALSPSMDMVWVLLALFVVIYLLELHARHKRGGRG